MKKKLNWEALKYGACPNCNSKLVYGPIYQCDSCLFRITAEKLETIKGYKKAEHGKTFYVDGFLRGSNPAKRGGFTVTDNKGNLIHREEVHGGERRITNNDVEALGIIYCLKNLCSEGDEIFSDSKCCIGWVKVGYSNARRDLFDILQTGRKLMIEKKVAVRWGSRWQNHAGLLNDRVRLSRHGIRNYSN